jgi:peptidyl-prolyl cis-trans isomerase B (cyclophilin B)
VTDLEELFQDAAALAEQGHQAPGDPIGGLTRARAAQRRRRWTMIAVPAVAAATVAVVAVATSVLPINGDGVVATRDVSPPHVFVALADGKAGAFDTEDGHLIRDFGTARALASAPDGVWTSSGTGCTSQLQFFQTGRSVIAAMPINGYVDALAISPHDGIVAYAVSHGQKQTDTGLPCGSRDLVVRDPLTGAERRWTGTADSGEIGQLSWSADGTELAFQTTVCCDATVTLHTLQVGSAPTPVAEVPSPRTDNAQCHYTLPTYAGDKLLAVRTCDARTELVDIGTAKDHVVQRLPFDDAVALAATGASVLVSRYGSATTPGELVRVDRDGTQVRLGTGFSQPTWAFPGSTDPTSAPSVESSPQPSAEPSAGSGLAPASPEAAVTCSYGPVPQESTSPRGFRPEKVGRDVGLPPTTPPTLPTGATIHTNRGDITLTLRPQTPCTVNSFTHLSSHGYYDDTPCFRLTTQGIYVLQCGDPSGAGTGGPGYTYADEDLTGVTYPAGTVAMANSGPGTNGSQFFLVYKDMQLDPNYTVFGHITAGLDVLAQVAAAGSTPAGDGKPNQPVQITSISLR